VKAESRFRPIVPPVEGLDARRSAAKILSAYIVLSGKGVTSDAIFLIAASEVLDASEPLAETNILRYKVGIVVPSEIKAVKTERISLVGITLVP